MRFYPPPELMLIKAVTAWTLAIVLLAGCDPQRIAQLQPGVSSEQDVRALFGEPDAVWDAPGGGRVLEFDRQPAGHENYMIDLGPDGKLIAVRQVLQPQTFAQVQPGMDREQVRRLLGKPAKTTPYPLKQETAVDWRFIGPANAAMVFTVWFDLQGRVLRAAPGPDPDAPEHRG